jgi:GTPase
VIAMGFWKAFTNRVKRLLGFKVRDGGFTLGIYGAPNAGKTLLANRMCEDWDAGKMGSVSEVPHETRNVERRTVILDDGSGNALRLEVMDTPGLVANVSLVELEALWGLNEAEAAERAREATEGILEAIRNLETADGMILVLDGARDPLQQVNTTLIAHVRARRLPHVVVANKMDLDAFNVDAVKRAFPNSPVVATSALERKNLDTFYDTLMRVFK